MFLVEGGEVPGGDQSDLYSGFTRYVSSAIEELQKEGVEVVFGSLRPRTPIHPVVEAMGCATFALDCSSSRGYPRAAFRLSRLIKRQLPDVLHLNEAIQGSVGGAAGALARHPTRIFHRHHVQHSRQMRLLTWLSSRLCHRTMAVSEAVRIQAVEREHSDPSRVCVALNGVPEPRQVSDDEMSALRRELGVDDGSYLAVIVGHLNPSKGHLLLVDALELAAKELREPIHLVVVGRGPLRPALERRLATAQGIVGHLVGHQTDVDPWYRISDVVVVPSETESFGLVAAEAMAAGCVVVASRIEGLAEMIETGRSGLLVEPKSPTSLSSVLVRVRREPELASQLRRGSRERYLDRLTVAAMVQGWLRCYQQAIERGTASRPGDD